MSKKMCLFLVEGPTDRLRLSLLNDLFDDSKIKFATMDGDVFTSLDYEETTKVKTLNSLNNDKIYNFSEFNEVYHVCDTDGCFINEDCIYENSEAKKTLYERNQIFTKSKINLIERNKVKASNLRDCNLKSNYKVLYFSTNVEDAFEEIQNPKANNKVNLSINCFRRYKNKPMRLLKKLYDMCPPVKSLKESWDFISSEKNSLDSWSNLFLFVLEHKNELKPEIQKKLNSYDIEQFWR